MSRKIGTFLKTEERTGGALQPGSKAEVLNNGE